jgi:hypothetical protein
MYIIGINAEFKKGYEPRNNLINDENGGSYSILDRWEDCSFSF